MKKIRKNLFLVILALIFILSIQKVNALEVGNYVKMTPTLKSYTISKEDTGFDEDQTINPSELNTWIIIKDNGDGTYDAVSQYVSSKDIYFKGQTGYQKYIRTLNKIANQYQNSEFTVGARYLGYNNQTEYISDASIIETSALDGLGSSWTNTADASKEVLNIYEPKGMGDVGYQSDYDLIKKLGIAKPNQEAKYWLASREFYFIDFEDKALGWYYTGRIIDVNGELDGYSMYHYINDVVNGISKFISDPDDLSNPENQKYANALRPVVRLKGDLSSSAGEGTSSSPYILVNNSNSDNNGNNGNNGNGNSNNNANAGSNQNNSGDNNKNEIDNPKTGSYISYIIIAIWIALIGVIYIVVKRKNKIYKI